MIKVNVTTNNGRISDLVDENVTLKSFLDSKGVNYARGINQLDGCPVNIQMMNSTFAQLGVRETCNFVSITKTDNA